MPQTSTFCPTKHLLLIIAFCVYLKKKKNRFNPFEKTKNILYPTLFSSGPCLNGCFFAFLLKIRVECDTDDRRQFCTHKYLKNGNKENALWIWQMGNDWVLLAVFHCLIALWSTCPGYTPPLAPKQLGYPIDEKSHIQCRCCWDLACCDRSLPHLIQSSVCASALSSPSGLFQLLVGFF